jgi:hypothetical protein
MSADVTDPVVRALIEALNSGDRDAFFAVLLGRRPQQGETEIMKLRPQLPG